MPEANCHANIIACKGERKGGSGKKAKVSHFHFRDRDESVSYKTHESFIDFVMFHGKKHESSRRSMFHATWIL